MALLNKKTKASSLVEVIIAMVIIAITFSLGIMIYINVIYSSYNEQKNTAYNLLELYAAQTKQQKSYVDQYEEIDGFIIEKKISNYNNDQYLILMELNAYNVEKKHLINRKEIVFLSED
jgi:Tfp pilus assembly protein PilV